MSLQRYSLYESPAGTLYVVPNEIDPEATTVKGLHISTSQTCEMRSIPVSFLLVATSISGVSILMDLESNIISMTVNEETEVDMTRERLASRCTQVANSFQPITISSLLNLFK